jgi:hypothetical protein
MKSKAGKYPDHCRAENGKNSGLSEKDQLTFHIIESPVLAEEVLIYQ